MKLFCNDCNKEFPVESGNSAEVNCPKCGKKIVKPESELAPGVVIGDFLIEKEISVGGMGKVFQARQISLDRPVALKVLLEKYTGDPEYVASLFREARAAAKISHPNIVQAYAVGQDGGFFYFAMELIRGDTLKNIMRKEGAMPAEKAARIIRDVANALDAAWREQKLVHQDIKPDNIMVDINGFSKLADLGLAKTGTMEAVSEESDEVLGTPQYISPEQLTGVPTDVRSDIYSLGATFYHIVTGKLPYRATDMTELAKMHDAGNLTPPKEVKPDLPDELNRIIIRMMSRDIDKRYQSPAELAADLEHFLVTEKVNAIDDIKLSVPKTSTPGTAAKALPQTVRPAAPGVARPGAARPAVPGSKTLRPAAPGGQAVSSPRPTAPSSQPSRPAAPAPQPPRPSPTGGAVVPGAYVPPENKESFWRKNRKSLIILIILAVAGVGILAVRLSSGNETSTAVAEVQEPESATDTVAAAAVEPEHVGGASEATDTVNEPVSTAEQPQVDEDAVRYEREAQRIREERIAKYRRNYAELARALEENVDAAANGHAAESSYVPSRTTFQNYEKPDLSRPEYVALANGIIVWREANPVKDMEFLQKVDEAWDDLRYPQTPQEYQLLSRLMNMYSALDEFLRCEAAREKARAEHAAVIAAARQRQDELRRQLQQVQDQRRQQQQEQARQAAENAQIKADAERQQQAGVRSLQEQVAHYLGTCLAALYKSAHSGDDKALNEAIQQAVIYTDTVRTFSNSERKIITDFKAMLAVLPAECTKLKSFFDRFRRIDSRRGIRIIVGRITVPLLQIKPGELVYRDRFGESKTIVYKDMEERTRITLMRSLERLRIENYEFYSDLFHGQLPADSTVPDGFWKKVWPLAKKTMF